MLRKFLASAAMLVLAAPAIAQTVNDVAVLQFAMALEQLENAFYTDGFANYSSTMSSDVKLQFQQITTHEAQHVAFLANALGSSAPPTCSFNFGVTSYAGFIGLARVLERTGVSAYTGALQSIDTNAIKTAAATIATIEARHASFLNVQNQLSGFPQSYDTPLGGKAIISITKAVTTTCPPGNPLSGAGFPALSISPASGAAGASLTVSTTATGGVSCLFYYNGGQATTFGVTQSAYATITNNACTVPAGVTGDVYVFVMNGTTAAYSPSNEANVVAGPAFFTTTGGNFQLAGTLSAAERQQSKDGIWVAGAAAVVGAVASLF
ncbi:hypothetical protein HKX48_008984 [Thoreauomyces humboldtii]|nr:hypothetical protein HKX48_008984 [Thoreauomyces humboldtii]